jgi:hypothetical protein
MGKPSGPLRGAVIAMIGFWAAIVVVNGDTRQIVNIPTTYLM